MSSEMKINPFTVIILVVSVIGIILLLALPFAGFYLPGYGNRFSCFSCEYYTGADLAAQIIILILLIVQVVIVLNELLPKRFIEMDLEIIGMALASTTILFAIIGLGSFGIAHIGDEWWPGTSFYSSIIAGILNLIIFLLKFKNK